jgi:calcium-dependent protein kinase
MDSEEIDDLLSNLDADENGMISYSEFLASTINPQNLLTKERTEAFFNYFDIDNSGYITVDEISKVFTTPSSH